MAFQFLPKAFLKNNGIFEGHRAQRPLLCVFSYNDHGFSVRHGLSLLCGLAIQRSDSLRFLFVAERRFAVLLPVRGYSFADGLLSVYPTHAASSFFSISVSSAVSAFMEAARLLAICIFFGVTGHEKPERRR